MIFEHEIKISLSDETHQYFDQYGQEYLSVSKFFEEFKHKFDPDGRILQAVARKNGITKKEQKGNWDAIAKVSNDRGTHIHYCIEEFWKVGQSPDPAYESLCQAIYREITKDGIYKAWYPEQRLFFNNVKISGTSDLPMERKARYEGLPVVDIFDYKTNKDGIVYFDKYKKFFKKPIDHLEQCNYNEYAMKMSIYGLMAEKTFNIKIGRLAIIFIPPLEPEAWFQIPIPYLKKEAIACVNHYINAIISVQQEG